MEGRAHSQLRHVAQQVSIIGNMDRVGLVDPGVTYVEFGAGRGMLSLALAAALPKIKLVLVDNSAVRWAPNNRTLLPFPDSHTHAHTHDSHLLCPAVSSLLQGD